jgi:hypothetical protein
MKIKQIVLSLSALFFCGIFSLHAQDENKAVLDAAKAGLSIYLEKIPAGIETSYGFNDRNEFKLATLGKPFPIYLLKIDFFTEPTVTPNKNYLVKSNTYKIPVIINGEYRSMLTVALMNGVWKTVGIGAAGLAKELGALEKKHPAEKALLSVHELECDFVILPNHNFPDVPVYLLFSSGMALNKKTDSGVYSLSGILPLLKEKQLSIKKR